MNASFLFSLQKGHLVWNPAIQGVVLGAYYYGYSTTQILGGRLAEKFGGRWLCGFGVLISAFATLLTPIAAEIHLAFIIIVRIIIGMSHGTVYTSLYVMLALWCPKHERATALSAITVGGNVGAALTMPLSSYLLEHYGWQSVFYVTGTVSVIWFFVWIYYATDVPSEHKSVTSYELNTIQAGLEMSKSQKDIKAPWKHILCSPAVWAIAAAKSCGMFGYYMLSTKLPTYLGTVLNMPTQLNGYINALTYVSVSITMAISGRLSDFIKQKYGVSLTLLRKVFETIALTGTAVCLAFIPTVGCDQNAVIVLLLLAMFVFGFTTGGDIPIVADIAPHFSGTIFGLTNTISVLSGVLSPIVVGLFVESDVRVLHILLQAIDVICKLLLQPKSVLQWSKAFYFSAGLGLFGNIAFCLWTTAVVQHWGTVNKSENECYNTFSSISKEPSDSRKEEKQNVVNISESITQNS
ncbi:Sialin-like protein [Leptotrombidium deliense]|uniref:Sialin-like protein n=1 Tax=Leptotrombidium deliense TaxID=299467 RepID=A0A443SD92_9ACAR|nr:Sialin-like protein [Leptotrombidium deliense]